jgi:hypothetical protein
LRQQIQREKHWQQRNIAGYHPLVIDWVGFFRPRLFGCLSKHYDSRAGYSLAGDGTARHRVGPAGAHRPGF